MFIQDWGGLLGLRLLEKYDDIIDRVVAANTGLPAGFTEPNEAFKKWRTFSQTTPNFDVGKVIQKATVTDLSPEIVAAYNAPFPDESYKAGAKIFPSLVPFGGENPECLINRKVWLFLQQYQKPFLTLFSDSDPIMKGVEKFFIGQIPGCKGMPHDIIKGGGHFLQEDKGEEIAEKVVAFIKQTA